LSEAAGIGAAVIGTGFIGSVHIGALRRLGVPIRGVLGSGAARGAERGAALGLRSYGSLDEMLADPGVGVVHVTSPNHAHFDQVARILAAGRHVVCEKPLAMTSAQSRQMVEMARAAGRVAAVCYNTRFYPLNQQARGMVADGTIGEVRLISGRYHQDWLAKETDWNWRLEGDKGGALRSVGDIGTHLADLTSFITGLRPVQVMADLATFVPVRQRPLGPVETFAAAAGATVAEAVTTDDAATLLLRYANGARGVMSTSQISRGRKNTLAWEVAGTHASAAWEGETPDQLWIGHRDAPNQVLSRDPGLMNATGAAAAGLPGGHVEGFADTFRALFAQVYADVARGGRGAASTWATFEDGHHEMLFCDAVLASAAQGGWADVAQG
jgi:predicted dehydrogenase